MPECAKTHLQQSRISKFLRGRTPGPPPPLQGEGGKENGGEGGERELKEEGKDREGTGGDRGGREGRNGGGEGREGRLTWAPSPLLETSSGSAPARGLAMM